MPMSDAIPNEALRQSDVPPRNADWSRVLRFAQTFNGYEQMGDQCAEVANHRREAKTLSDFRACLFFEYRRHNHFGYPPDTEKMQYIYELLDRIREQARAR
jgi:hypothetical protein